MEYTTLNPRGVRSDIEIFPLTSRLPSLDGKVVYCIEQNRPVFMEELSKKLAQFVPGTKFVFIRKPGGFANDDLELLMIRLPSFLNVIKKGRTPKVWG